MKTMNRLAASFIGIAAWGLAAFFSLRYPMADSLEAGSLAPAWGWAWIILLAGALAYAFWMWPSFPESGKKSRRPPFGFLLLFSLLAQVLLALYAARVLHRDFLTLIFQAVAIHYALFLDAAPHYRSSIYLKFAELLFIATILLVFFFLSWIFLMGYAIASRSEPRWIPSIGYNVLNLAICIFLLLANFSLKDRSKRELIVASDALLLDNLDVLPLFSPSAKPLAIYFVQHADGPGLICSEAQHLIGADACDRSCSKATNCSEYRYLYNRIHEVKKVFFALKIGVITSPENKQTILENGWTFLPDSSIRILGLAGGQPNAHALH